MAQVFLALEDGGRDHRLVRSFRTQRERDAWVMAGPNRRVISRRDSDERETLTHIQRSIRLRVALHDRLVARAEKAGRSFDAELARILEVVLGG